VAGVRILLRRGHRSRRGGQRHGVHDLKGAATADDFAPQALRALGHHGAGAIGGDHHAGSGMRVVSEPPHRLARGRLDFVLDEHLIARAHQPRATPYPRHAAVNRREIVNRERTRAAGLGLIGDQRCHGIEHHISIRTWVDGEGVLSLGPHAVVIPAIRAGARWVAEVAGQGVVIAAEVVEPALAQCIDYKCARIEITMIRAHFTGFHPDEGRAGVVPLAAHGYHFLGKECRAGFTGEGHVRSGAAGGDREASVIVPP